MVSRDARALGRVRETVRIAAVPVPERADQEPRLPLSVEIVGLL